MVGLGAADSFTTPEPRAAFQFTRLRRHSLVASASASSSVLPADGCCSCQSPSTSLVNFGKNGSRRERSTKASAPTPCPPSSHLVYKCICRRRCRRCAATLWPLCLVACVCADELDGCQQSSLVCRKLVIVDICFRALFICYAFCDRVAADDLS